MKNKVKPEELKENIKKSIKKDGNKLFKIDKDYREKSLNSKIKDDIVKNIKLKIEKKKKDNDVDKPKESITPTEENIQEVLDNITPVEIDAIATETLKWYRYDTNRGEPAFWVKSEYKPELKERLKNFNKTGIFHDGVSVNDVLKKNPLYSIKNLDKLELMDIYKYDSKKRDTIRDYESIVQLTGYEALYQLITDLDKLIAVVAVLEYRSLYYISVLNGVLGEEAMRANIDKVINEHLRGIPDKYRKATDDILKDLKNTEYSEGDYQSEKEVMKHVITIYKGCELYHLPLDFIEVDNMARRGTNIIYLQNDIKEISNFSENPFNVGLADGERDGYAPFIITSFHVRKTIDLSISFKLRSIIDLDEKGLTGLRNSVNTMFNFMQEHKRSLVDFVAESHSIDTNSLTDKEKEVMRCKKAVYYSCRLGSEFSQMIASIVNITYKILMNSINPVYDKIFEEIAFHVAEMGLQDVIHDVLKAEI